MEVKGEDLASGDKRSVSVELGAAEIFTLGMKN